MTAHPPLAGSRAKPVETRQTLPISKDITMDFANFIQSILAVDTGRRALVVVPEELGLSGVDSWPGRPQVVAPQNRAWKDCRDTNVCIWLARASEFQTSAWIELIKESSIAHHGGSFVLVLLDLHGEPSELRSALERSAFACGWRKHPAYCHLVDYEDSGRGAAHLVVPLEKIPGPALGIYPLEALRQERDLHMDMLREAGERSDAHLVRYRLAAEQIRTGDRVLDAACGLGYGSYLLASLSRCASVLGVDGSDYAITYAQENFAANESRLSFRKGWLPDDLASLADASFDVIVSFETLEHIQDPAGLLAEFDRLLRPGGRVIASVPNDWSDETGKDPNPHHLHVYTLDLLRGQFSRHFVRDRLFQQIASGCKRQAAGNAWTPAPRTLRELPVDTVMPPDSEWWILLGHKPHETPSLDYRHTTFDGVVPSWAQSDTGDRLASGLVLAMHCVPADVDPRVERFWSALARSLAECGHTLVLLSTTGVQDPSLHVIDMPYELTGFSEKYSNHSSSGIAPDEQSVFDAVRWYGCTHDSAKHNLRLAQEFFDDLLRTLKPCSVLGWQVLNPLTRLLRQTAVRTDIPFRSVERGWVRNTLQVDMGGFHQLSDVHLGFANERLRRGYRPTADVLDALTRRARSAPDLGRYASAQRKTATELRRQLGIPTEARVAVVFTHGEPGINAMGGAAVREFHDLSPELLQQRFDAVSDSLVARGFWVLVQEHPFNQPAGRALRLPAQSRVVAVTESVSSLLDLAEVCLFTLATLQFDAVFLGKSIGLLSRSGLYRDGVPPFMGDHSSADGFLDALLDESAWEARSRRLQADVAFVFEHCLLDLEDEALEHSAAECASWLSRLQRPLDAGFHERVGRFLLKWAG